MTVEKLIEMYSTALTENRMLQVYEAIEQIDGLEQYREENELGCHDILDKLAGGHLLYLGDTWADFSHIHETVKLNKGDTVRVSIEHFIISDMPESSAVKGVYTGLTWNEYDCPLFTEAQTASLITMLNDVDGLMVKKEGRDIKVEHIYSGDIDIITPDKGLYQFSGFCFEKVPG